MSYTRVIAHIHNDLVRSLGALLGIAQGVLCDGQLSDEEIRFLEKWLTENETLSVSWPGDVLHTRIKSALADNVITREEREHLVETLERLIGGTEESLIEATHVSELPIDRAAVVVIPGSLFCLTGDFVFAPRAHCEDQIQKRGGAVSSSVTKRLTYLVVGSLGSKEWKHGSFGTKVQKAMELKRQGLPILVVHEDQWANAL